MGFIQTCFPGVLIKTVFSVAVLISVLSEVVIFAGTSVINKRKDGEKQIKDHGTIVTLIVGSLVAILVNPVWDIATSRYLPVFFFWIGAAFILCGVIIRIYAVWSMREFFTTYIQIGSSQKVFKAGPYRFVRHPAYFGSIVLLVGFSLCFRTIFGVISSLLISAFIFSFRISFEEKELVKRFGSEYGDYKKHTWGLIPGIW